jgi:hypothetical protein
MTVLRWPTASATNRPKSLRKLIVDPFPQSVLHQLVAHLPGPKHETETERATRFDAQLAEVLSYHPRDSADALLAGQCILLRLLAEDCHRDANRPSLDAAKAKKLLRTAKQFDKLLDGMKQTLARRHERPVAKMDPAMFVSLGLEQFLIPDPDDPNNVEEAFSAIIVPLHPAPKALQ